jgi:hypothetical protein
MSAEPIPIRGRRKPVKADRRREPQQLPLPVVAIYGGLPTPWYQLDIWRVQRDRAEATEAALAEYMALVYGGPAPPDWWCDDEVWDRLEEEAEAAAQLAVEIFRTYVESWYTRDWWSRWRRETR